MAPRKKKPATVRQAAKPPVINLKATEVKSATEKAEEARKRTQEKAQEKAQETAKAQSEPATANKASAGAKPEGPDDKKPVTGGKAKPAAMAQKKNKRTGLVMVSLAALVAAGFGGAWAFKTYGAQFFADPNAVRAEQLAGVVARVAKLEAAVAESKNNSENLASLKKLLAESRATLMANQKAIQTNAKKLAVLEETASEVRVALAKAVENGTGPVAAANELQFKVLSEKFAELDKNLASLKKASDGGNNQELASLKTRFDAMLVRLNAAEQQNTAMVKSLDIVTSAQDRLASAIASAPASNPASELAGAFTVLRAKISAGGSYEAELDQVAGLMPQEIGLDVLRPFARLGVPSLTALTSKLQEAEVAVAAPMPENSENAGGGVFGALTNRLTGLVKVTRAGQADWPGLKEKALAALASGQVESAANILRDGADAPAVVTKWLSQADNKIRVDQAVKSLSAKIVARLTAGGE